MWADEEDDDKKNKRVRKERQSYSTPVAFVSGGIKIGDKVTKEEKEDGSDVSVSFYFVRISCICKTLLTTNVF